MLFNHFGGLMTEKKNILKAAAAAVSAGATAIAMTACSAFSSATNVPVNVYGPPPNDEPTPIETPGDIEDPEQFDPSSNVPVDVYGPPWEMGSWQGEIPDDYEAKENIPTVVYGPPPGMFDRPVNGPEDE